MLNGLFMRCVAISEVDKIKLLLLAFTKNKVPPGAVEAAKLNYERLINEEFH